MNDKELIALINKFNDGSLSEQEKIVFFRWYNEAGLEEFSHLLNAAGVVPDTSGIEDISLESFRKKLSLQEATEIHIPAEVHLTRISWRWLAAAVVFALVVTGGIVAYRKDPTTAPAIVQQASASGPEKATLILADGTTVVLDQQNAGNIATQGGMSVIKTGNDQLVYQGEGKDLTGINTLTIPRGGQFQITLADGTRVWLNAASSLKYPVVFSGSSREVVLDGEAYFEVAEDHNHPFLVKSEKMNVHVIGTAFNIMAYKDENEALTTLINGAVKVTDEAAAVMLAPGQQAAAGEILRVNKHVNLDDVLAWKKGEFRFNVGIKTIMRQVARWYDVEIEYYGPVPENEFSGVLSRKDNVRELLDGLEIPGNVHFEINGKKITVIKGPARKKIN